MRKTISLLLAAVFIIQAFGVIGASSRGVTEDRAGRSCLEEFTTDPSPELYLGRSEPPLGSFIENIGQMGEGAGSFYYLGYPISIALGTSWLSYRLEPDDEGGGDEGTLVRVDFDDCRPARPTGVIPDGGRSNYLIGNEPDRWHVDVKMYRAIQYRDLWEGVDLRYRLTDQGLKYEFVLLPGSSPSVISMKVSGHQDLSLDGDGSLRISTPTRDILDTGLRVFYQDAPGELISGTFELRDGERYGFALGDYDGHRTVVIDPLVFSTLLGGSRTDEAWSHSTDDKGYIYVTGVTESGNFPTTAGA